jgi:hypothetical protein
MRKFWKRADPRVAPVTPPSPPKPTVYQQQLKFCSDLAIMKHRAMELGLYRTMHRLDDAVRMVGFEVAGMPDVCTKIEKQREDAYLATRRSE